MTAVSSNMAIDGWTRLTLGDVATLQRGIDLPVQNREPGNVPVVASNGPVGAHKSTPVRGPGVVTGRSGTIGKVFYYETDFWPLNTTLYVSDFHGNEPRFVAWLLRGMALEKHAASTGVPSLNRNFVHPLPVLLPPLPEQRKIAAILSAVDEVIEKTEAVIESLQVLKKAMMQELLTRGLPGRHTRFKQTEIGEIPEEWEVVRASDVCELITKGATPASQTSEPGGVRFLKVYNIDPAGFVDFDYRPTFIPRETHEGELKRSRVQANDVLMNIVGPPLGKVAVVPGDWLEANINQAIAVFRPSTVESRYLSTCLSAPHLFAWAATRAKRTSTQLNLTLELCRDYPLPLPSADERKAIVGALNSASVRLTAEAHQLQAAKSAKAALMSVLLTGELRVTPDEDAA